MSTKADILLTGSDTSPFVSLNHHKASFSVSLFIGVPSGVTGAVSVEISSKEDFEAASSIPLHLHDKAKPLTLIPNSTHFLSILSPSTAVRFVGSGISGGNIEITILQAGNIV